LNSDAQSLTKNESNIFKESKELQSLVIKSFELMLNFYGMELNQETGKIQRNEKLWKQRYEFLDDSFHNYLRITRILNCLELVGLGHLKIEWISLFVEEIFQNQLLKNAKSSLIQFWIPTLRKNSELIKIEKMIQKYSKVDRREYKIPPISWAFQFEFDEQQTTENETVFLDIETKEFKAFQGKGNVLK
jgi:c-di-AMP phosphodiesterase-like protein